ncbi:hypothetical protein BC629DRAFT_86375 [Irpex lacteus]|nr:hypothetical protein BC629DRAFT_86375 [Irpex lacteus]
MLDLVCSRTRNRRQLSSLQVERTDGISRESRDIGHPFRMSIRLCHTHTHNTHMVALFGLPRSGQDAQINGWRLREAPFCLANMCLVGVLPFGFSVGLVGRKYTNAACIVSTFDPQLGPRHANPLRRLCVALARADPVDRCVEFLGLRICRTSRVLFFHYLSSRPIIALPLASYSKGHST